MYTVAAACTPGEHEPTLTLVCESKICEGIIDFFLCTSPARFLKGEREEGLLKHTSEHVDA